MPGVDSLGGHPSLHFQQKKAEMTDTFYAVVKAPQGGPIYVHDFEGPSVADVLRRIADGVDLDAAERVDIAIVPGYRSSDALAEALSDETEPQR